VAKNRNPAKVIKIIFVESPRLAKDMPDMNSEIDNVFTCLLYRTDDHYLILYDGG
jgi:hypothetical protein